MFLALNWLFKESQNWSIWIFNSIQTWQYGIVSLLEYHYYNSYNDNNFLFSIEGQTVRLATKFYIQTFGHKEVDSFNVWGFFLIGKKEDAYQEYMYCFCDCSFFLFD